MWSQSLLVSVHGSTEHYIIRVERAERVERVERSAHHQ